MNSGTRDWEKAIEYKYCPHLTEATQHWARGFCSVCMKYFCGKCLNPTAHVHQIGDMRRD